jgi:hypothetical protein
LLNLLAVTKLLLNFVVVLAHTQVLELVSPERQAPTASLDQAGADAAGCEQLLVLHQLTWQLEAMQALLQLQAAHGSTSASE